MDFLRRSSPLCLLACFLCSILSGDLLIEPGAFSLHRVQPVIESHQRVYLQSTSDASVEIPVAKESGEECNKQAGSLNVRMNPATAAKNIGHVLDKSALYNEGYG